MWSTKGNPNPSSSEEEEDLELEYELMTFAFVFGHGFRRQQLQRLQVSVRRQLVISEEKECKSLVLGILSRIVEDDLPDGILEDSKLVNYIYSCLVQLPKDLPTFQLLFRYTNYDDDQQFVVQARWKREMVHKQLDDIEEEQVCAVCLEDLRIGNEVTYLSCKHVFHPKCIVKWGTIDIDKACCSCPLCRFPFSGYFHSLYFPLSYHEDNHDGLRSIVQNYASDHEDD